MCVINLVFKKDRNPDERLSQYMNVVSWNAWQNKNDDGEGMFAFRDLQNGKPRLCTAKSVSKHVYKGSWWFIASHQRWATSGNPESNVHPHATKHLLVQHNGVFWNLGDKDNSDTKNFSIMLEEAYVRNDSDLVKAVKEVLLEVYGSYSVVVYEKITGKVFYFKDYSTKMYIAEDSKYLVMSTDESSVKYAMLFFGINQKKMDVVCPYLIVDVFDGFKSVAKFEETTVRSDVKKSDLSSQVSIWEYDEKEKKSRKTAEWSDEADSDEDYWNSYYYGKRYYMLY